MPLKSKSMKHKKLFGGQEIKYHLYTKEEADRLMVHYVPWKKVKEEMLPCYVLDDAGVVGMFLDKRLTGKGNVYYYYSPWGNFIVSPGKKNKIKVYFRIEDKPREEERDFRTGKKKNIALMKKAMVYYISRGLTREESLELMNLAPQGAIANWMETEEFEFKMSKEIEKILAEAGITKNTVIENYKEAFEVAKAKKDAKAMAEITDRIAALHRMNVKLTMTVKETHDLPKLPSEASNDLAKLTNLAKEPKGKSVEHRTLTATAG